MRLTGQRPVSAFRPSANHLAEGDVSWRFGSALPQCVHFDVKDIPATWPISSPKLGPRPGRCSGPEPTSPVAGSCRRRIQVLSATPRRLYRPIGHTHVTIPARVVGPRLGPALHLLSRPRNARAANQLKGCEVGSQSGVMSCESSAFRAQCQCGQIGQNRA
jgi:hypothetical protein